jgi:hypothetical protein
MIAATHGLSALVATWLPHQPRGGARQLVGPGKQPVDSVRRLAES